MALKEVGLLSIVFAVASPICALSLKTTRPAAGTSAARVMTAPAIQPPVVPILTLQSGISVNMAVQNTHNEAPAGTVPEIGASVAEILGAQALNAAVTPTEAGGMTGVAEGNFAFDHQLSGSDKPASTVSGLSVSSIQQPARPASLRARGSILLRGALGVVGLPMIAAAQASTQAASPDKGGVMVPLWAAILMSVALAVIALRVFGRGSYAVLYYFAVAKAVIARYWLPATGLVLFTAAVVAVTKILS